MDASGLRVAVLVSRWNELVTSMLLAGALDELARHSCTDVTVVHVPGAWEIPVVAAEAVRSGAQAVVALGCIIQGATGHAGQLAREVGDALVRLQTESGVPVAWGVLTPENQEQAFERAGLKLGNKGREAALAAIETASVLGQMRDQATRTS